jgi:uncharacterized protein (DUF1697 family)
MPTYIALLQGINIGPRKRIRMEDLRALVAGLGGEDVRTYVNSGNAVFTHHRTNIPALEKELETALRDHIGIDVPAIIRTGEDLARVLDGNPFPQASEPKTLHVLFLRDKPAIADVNTVEEMETGADLIAIHGREVYAFLPNYTTGATVDLMKVARALGVDATARNWNTVTRLADMAGRD